MPPSGLLESHAGLVAVLDDGGLQAVGKFLVGCVTILNEELSRFFLVHDDVGGILPADIIILDEDLAGHLPVLYVRPEFDDVDRASLVHGAPQEGHQQQHQSDDDDPSHE